MNTLIGSPIREVALSLRTASRAPARDATGPSVRAAFGCCKRPDHASFPAGEICKVEAWTEIPNPKIQIPTNAVICKNKTPGSVMVGAQETGAIRRIFDREGKVIDLESTERAGLLFKRFSRRTKTQALILHAFT